MQHSNDPKRESWTQAKLHGIETAKKLLRDVRVVPMEDTIHDVPIQRPKELAAAIIDFAASIN